MNLGISYPYEGQDEYFLERYQHFKIKYQLDDDDDLFIKNISNNILSEELIELHALSHLSQKDQLRLWRIIKIAKHFKIGTAAANALMILVETGFAFRSKKGKYFKTIRDISLKGLHFKFKDLYGIEFLRCDLQDFEALGCSFTKMQFIECNLNGMKLGRLPYLVHQSQLVAGDFSNGKSFVSQDEKVLYEWDLADGSLLQTKELSQQQNQAPFLLNNLKIFFAFLDENYFIRASSSGIIELWKLKPFELVWQDSNFRTLSLVSTTSKKNQFLTVVRLSESSTETVILWEIGGKKTSFPIEDVRHLCYSARKELIAKVGANCAINFYNLNGERIDQFTIQLEVAQVILLKGMQFTPNGNQLLLAMEYEVYSYDFLGKNPSITCLFSERGSHHNLGQSYMGPYISQLHLIPSTPLITYNLDSVFCIRDASRNYALVARTIYLDEGKESFVSDGQHFARLFKNIVQISPIKEISFQTSIPFKSEIATVAFDSTNQTMILINSFGEQYRYKMITGRQVSMRGLEEHRQAKFRYFISLWTPHTETNHIYYCKYSSDSSLILGGYKDSKESHIYISDSISGKVIFHYEGNFSIFAVSKNKEHLLIVHNNQLSLWSLHSREYLGAVKISNVSDAQVEAIISPSIFPTGCIAISDLQQNKLTIWEIDWTSSPGKSICVAELPSALNLRFVNDRLFFAEGGIKCWHRTMKKIYSLGINEFDFDISQDGSLMVTSSYLSTFLQSWNLATDPPTLIDTFSLYESLEYPKVRIDPLGRFVVCWDKAHLYFLSIVEGKFKILWKIPQELKYNNTLFYKSEMSKAYQLLLKQIGAQLP